MEDEEIYGQLLYKMTKNFSTYVRYGQLTKENTTTNVQSTDGTVGRDRKSTRLNSSHLKLSRMPSSA